jgi:Flp pilus assembly secretin CpaC
MSAFRVALLTAAAALVSGTALADGVDAKLSGHMRVDYEQSTVVHLDKPVKTVLVGNPLIADAMLVNEKTIYVLGRMFGNTNIIAVDDTGAEIWNSRVTVGTPTMAQVTIYRGPQGQRNLACSPHCERTVTQGDAEMDGIYQNADKKVDVSQKSAALSNGK